MILVVEDPREYGRLLESALQGLGYPLRSAGGTSEALRAALEKKPRLVVADAALPDASGFELCRVLRQRPELAGVRVLVVCGTHNPEQAQLSKEGYAPDAIISKPFRVADLHAAVKRLLA